MYNVGVLPLKALPPHRGHINAIIHAATKCNRLYVVVSDHPELTKQLCEENNLPIMDLKLRTKWLSQELQKFDHIKVLMLDESSIPAYPNGWEPWSKLLRFTVPEKFDVIFGGEPSYVAFYEKYQPGVTYELFDFKRERYPISATEIRKDPLKNWDYILGSARGFFTKKILLTGTESCGKTTMTKYLAKIYHTSWTEEEGRYYSERYLGLNEEVFTIKDFGRIAYMQHEKDLEALHDANKVVFFDTDALVTQYYAELYLNEKSDLVESFIDPAKYDIVLLFKPDVKWVDDGIRWLSGDIQRLKMHEKLKQMYIDHGFGDKIVEISGTYAERLDQCMGIVDKLIQAKNA